MQKAEKKITIEEELKNLKEELEAQTWGLGKTNDAIKLLYKELEVKNKELQKLDQLKSDFLSTVSHELRTPLTSIREGVSQVLDGILGATTEDQREFLSISLEDIDRLKRIIDNLLDISKIEAKKFELKREIVDIAALVRGVLSSFSAHVKSKGLNLVENLPKEKIEVYADKDKIIQVFVNLIGNALKFTREGYIEVAAKDNGGEVVCYVADTGIGIAEEDMVKVFDKFQQFGRIPGAGEKGTGLGLSIAKGIIELHKSHIGVESEIGKGTKFMFTLPKYTLQEVFAEYVADGIQEAKEQSVPLSLLIFDFKNFDELVKKMSSRKVSMLMETINKLVNDNLRRKADMAIKDTRAILVMLPATDKTGAGVIAERLYKVLTDYLAKEFPSEKIEVVSRIAAFPDDGKEAGELLDKIGEEENKQL